MLHVKMVIFNDRLGVVVDFVELLNLEKRQIYFLSDPAGLYFSRSICLKASAALERGRFFLAINPRSA